MIAIVREWQFAFGIPADTEKGVTVLHILISLMPITAILGGITLATGIAYLLARNSFRNASEFLTDVERESEFDAALYAIARGE